MRALQQWLDRFCYKHPRLSIPGLMRYIVIGNVLDPVLLGQTLRLSSFGIILSLAFWGAIWGIAGMFLAVPIMVAAMIICAHIPWLRPIAILLSHEGLPDQDETEDESQHLDAA